MARRSQAGERIEQRASARNGTSGSEGPDGSAFNATDIVSAVLLAGTGGLLDAVVYLNHGQVFANAMTGNVILLGIAAIEHDWMRALRHLGPIAAFLIGVVAASVIRDAPHRHSALFVLAIEAGGLCCIGFLPAGFPELAYVAFVAFLSAFQVATFRRVGRFTYNSTFVTGNLRMVAEGFFDWRTTATAGQRSKGRAQFLKLSAICASFLVGALAGAFVAVRFPVHAILFAEPPLVAALILILLSRPPAPKPAAARG